MIHTPVRGRRSCAESAPWPPRRWQRRLHSSRRLRGKPGRAVLQREPRASAPAHRRCPCRTRWRSRAPRVNSTRREHGQADDAALARARASAADVPLQVCRVASDLVVLATDLASGPMPERRLDLWGVVQLAAGACSCAALLVCANAALDADDARSVQARQAESAARAAAHRFLDEATTAKAAD